MGHTWVQHREHRGFWRCPNEALAEFADKGWEPCEAPPPPNPAVAERIAAERQRDATREAARRAETTKPTKAAVRGKSEE